MLIMVIIVAYWETKVSDFKPGMLTASTGAQLRAFSEDYFLYGSTGFKFRWTLNFQVDFSPRVYTIPLPPQSNLPPSVPDPIWERCSWQNLFLVLRCLWVQQGVGRCRIDQNERHWATQVLPSHSRCKEGKADGCFGGIINPKVDLM